MPNRTFIASGNFEEHNKKMHQEQLEREAKKDKVQVVCVRMDKNATKEEREEAYAEAKKWGEKRASEISKARHEARA